MPEFYFAVRVRVDISRYESGQALLDRWLQEAEAAEGAEQAGVIQTLWKDVAEPTVYGVLRIEADNALQAHATVLEAVKGLPMGQDNALIVGACRRGTPLCGVAAILTPTLIFQIAINGFPAGDNGAFV